MVHTSRHYSTGQSTHNAVIMENEEPPVSHDSNPVVSDAPQDPPQFCVGSPKESNPGEPPTDHELQVHILEHAMNGYCSMPVRARVCLQYCIELQLLLVDFEWS